MRIRLMNAKISDNYVYPGEILYIKCGFEALDDFPTSLPLKLFAEMDLGYQRSDPEMATSYRAEASIYPQPMFYRKGETYYSTIRWQLPDSVWAGTYKVTIGMCDENRNCVAIECNGEVGGSFCIGAFDVAFSGIAKDFVSKNKRQVFTDFGTACGRQAYRKSAFDTLIKIRRKSDDKNIYVRTEMTPNSVYEDEYIKFRFCFADDKYYICDVNENDGFEFLCAAVPTMFTEQGRYLFNTNGGGRRIDVNNALPWGYENKYYTILQ